MRLDYFRVRSEQISQKLHKKFIEINLFLEKT
jgi:hypothetical protein